MDKSSFLCASPSPVSLMENHTGDKDVIHTPHRSLRVGLTCQGRVSLQNTLLRCSWTPRGWGGVAPCMMASISLTPAGCPRIQLTCDTRNVRDTIQPPRGEGSVPPDSFQPPHLRPQPLASDHRALQNGGSNALLLRFS